MKRLFFLLFLLTLPACSLFNPTEHSVEEPILLKQAPLPEIPASFQNLDFSFICEMLIDKNGNVETARLIESSGDKYWDSLAVLTLLNWQFSPLLYEGVPLKKLIRRKVNVIFTDPNEMVLAEIIFNTLAEAESIYTAVTKGENFFTLAKQYSISDSKINGGRLGKVDINHYSENISRVLEKLKVNEFTNPVVYGKYFAIFKRLKENQLY
ncbi:MAG: TonB family protein [Ignavibacteriaceae bacterium]